MGGGDEGDPLIGPTTDAGDSSPASDDDARGRQTDIDEHSSEPEPEESGSSGTPSTGNPTTGSPTGGTGDGTTPTPPPSGGSSEGDSDGEDEEEDSESGVDQQTEAEEREIEPEPDEEPEAEEEDDDEDDDDEQTAQVVVHSDPWDNVGFGLYPIRFQLKEEYGDQVQIDDRLIPVREFGSPEEMAHQWEIDARRHEMPVNKAAWSADPPSSTELANRAYAAACKQGVSLAKKYMRRLRVAAIIEGLNIEDREILFDLAEEVGLDIDELAEAWDEVDLQTSGRDVETPKTTIHVDGETITHPGYLHVDDLKTMFEQAGLEEDDPQPLAGFVREYGPVAIKEVQQVYGLNESEAFEKLENNDEIIPVSYGATEFWTSHR